MSYKLQVDKPIGYQKPTIDILHIVPEQGFAGSTYDDGMLSGSDAFDQGTWE